MAVTRLTALVTLDTITEDLRDRAIDWLDDRPRTLGAFLAKLGCTYVVVGHSERREYHQESDALVNAKATAAIGAGITPIVCVGETLEQRERNETMAVLDRQLKDGFDGLTAEPIAGLVIAYEPVWAIGTGRTATAAQAGEAHAHIRSRLRQWFGAPSSPARRAVFRAPRLSRCGSRRGRRGEWS